MNTNQATYNELKSKINAQEMKEQAEERINRVYADLPAEIRQQMIAATNASIDAKVKAGAK